MTHTDFDIPRFAARALAAVGFAAALAACAPNMGGAPDEGVGYRQARFEEIARMRDYRACRDEALEFDRQARDGSASARYLASARLIERCEAELGPEAAHLAPDERMRAYALSVQNYMKGGDVAKARANLLTFKTTFPDRDLYYPDGSSFIDTMDLLLGLRDRDSVGQFPTVNANAALKAELRRTRYWKVN